MQAIRALIVDDEPLAREGIRLLLGKIPSLAIVGECQNGRQALAALKSKDVDLMFLDIQMPEMDGFQMLARIPTGRMPLIIFITAYDRYALQAFRVHAMDYVLKPLDEDRFREAVGRAVDIIRQRRVNEFASRLAPLLAEMDQAPRAGKPQRPAPAPYPDTLPVPAAGRIILVRTDEIDYIRAADYYAELHVGKQTHLLRETIASLERRLDPERFIRIHRSHIVNLARVRSLEPLFNGEYIATLDTGANLKISKTYLAALKKKLQFA